MYLRLRCLSDGRVSGYTGGLVLQPVAHLGSLRIWLICPLAADVGHQPYAATLPVRQVQPNHPVGDDSRKSMRALS
jgi:hypothetical protein